MLFSLTEKDLSGHPNDFLPLYRRGDGKKIAVAMPVFNELGPMLTGPPPPAASSVLLPLPPPEGEARSASPSAGSPGLPPLLLVARA